MLMKMTALSQEERDEYTYRCQVMSEAINEKNKAVSKLVENVSEILRKQLWREDFSSKEEFLQVALNTDMTYVNRLISANRIYLYLISQTDDEDEQHTLSNLKESAYRELRRISCPNEKLLRNKLESNEEYQKRIAEKEAEDLNYVNNLWKIIYPKISHYKLKNRIGLLPTGGYAITAGDITETSRIISNVSNNQFDLNGRSISIDDVVARSAVNNTPAIEVIDTLVDLGVSEVLDEKFKRQQEHIRQSVEYEYHYDKYYGKLKLMDGKLCLVNEFVTHDLTREFSDLLGEETIISIRRKVND